MPWYSMKPLGQKERSTSRFEATYTNADLAAFSDFQVCAALMREWHIDAPVLIPWRLGLAEANVRFGRKAAAAY